MNHLNSNLLSCEHVNNQSVRIDDWKLLVKVFHLLRLPAPTG